MEEYLKILRAIHAGRPVSQKDLSYFASFHGGDKFDTKAYEQLKTKLASEEGLASFTDSDWEKYMNEAKNRLTTDPAYREQTLALAQKTGSEKASSDLKNGLNLLLAGTDIATSLGQIGQSKAAASQLTRPGRPPVLQRDALLERALNNSQQGILDQSAAINPAKLANLDQYQADLAAARTASTGQAGAYGAYAQVAANRRDKANAGLVPLANDIRRQNQGLQNQLIGMDLSQNQAINQSQNQNYGLDLYQFNTDRAAANQLGQTGRYNLRSSLTGLAGSLVPVGAQIANQRYQDIFNKGMAYGPEHAQTMAGAAHQADYLWNGGAPQDMYRGMSKDIYEQAYGL